MESWDKGTSSNGGQTSAWDNAGGDICKMKEQTNGWEKDAGGGNSLHVSLDDKLESWSTKVKISVGDDIWSKGIVSYRENFISTFIHIDMMDACDVTGKSVSGKEADGWGKDVSSSNKNVSGADNSSWGKTSEISNQNKSTSPAWKQNAHQTVEHRVQPSMVHGEQSSESWEKPACDQSDDWGKSIKSTKSEQSSNWEKTVPAACDLSGGWGRSDKPIQSVSMGMLQNEQSNKWEKTVSSSSNVSDGWGKLDTSTKVAPLGGDWANACEKMSTSSSVNGSQSRLWEKPKVSSGVPSDNWIKPNNGAENESGGWQKTKALNLGEANGCNKLDSSNNAWGGERNQPNRFGGVQNNSQGRGKGRNFNSEGGRQSSNCGRGGDWNQHGNTDDKSAWGSKCNDKSERKDQDSWNESSNFGGKGDYKQKSEDISNGSKTFGRGFSRDQQNTNSGNAFSGNSSNWGNDKKDSWGNSSVRNDDWGSKSNYDPERKGQDSWSAPNNFGSRGGDGSGCEDRDQSSWKNDQQDHRDVAFSDHSSSWGKNQYDSWGKSDSSVRNKGSDWNSRGENVDDEATGSFSNWDRPKTYSSAKDTEWTKNEGTNWSKPKDADSSGRKSWNQTGGWNSGGHAGRSGNWNRGERSFGGGGRGRGRNFNRDREDQQNSYGNWNQEKNISGKQSSGGFEGNSSRAGWSTEKGILEFPESRSDWSSSSWGKNSGTIGKDSGTNQHNSYKSSMGPPKLDGEWQNNSWGKEAKNGSATSESKSDWSSSGSWGGKDNTNKGSMGPPRSDGEWHSNSWEKGSSSAEKAEMKDALIQEKTPAPYSQGGEKCSGGWEKPKDKDSGSKGGW